MEIKQRLNELSELIRGRIVKHQFELKSIGKFTASIEIDGCPFEIWIANGDFGIKVDKVVGLFNFDFTDEEKVMVWSYFEPLIERQKIEEKRGVIQMLQEEIREMEEKLNETA